MRFMKLAGFWQRFAALLVDVFMILIPIAVMTHLAVDYKARPIAALAMQTAVYGAITVWFWVNRGYTPGKKFARLIVLDKRSGKTMLFWQACWRFICQCVCFAAVFSVLLAVFRKDKRALHDILSLSMVARI